MINSSMRILKFYNIKPKTGFEIFGNFKIVNAPAGFELLAYWLQPIALRC